jgi:DNA-binding NarL/FixJ family response regulator
MDLNVLMVDDHPPIIEGYKSILSFNTFGYNLNTIAAYSCEAAYAIITEKLKPIAFDIVLVDVTLPPYQEKDLESGEDIVLLVKQHLPGTKIIMLTSHSESLVIYRILNGCDPDGLLVKSDFLPDEFLLAFDTVVKGERYYSSTVRAQRDEMMSSIKTLDSYNRQIIMLMSQGVKTKNFHDYINLSTSAIEKRKAIIKDYFGIGKGTDEDILREARKQGLI